MAPVAAPLHVLAAASLPSAQKVDCYTEMT